MSVFTARGPSGGGEVTATFADGPDVAATTWPPPAANMLTKS